MPLSWPAEYAATFSSEVPALPKCVCLSICLVCLPARPPHGPSPLSPRALEGAVSLSGCARLSSSYVPAQF